MFMKASKNAVYLKGSPHFIYIVLKLFIKMFRKGTDMTLTNHKLMDLLRMVGKCAK